MIALRISTITICIQAVQKQIEYFEGLLESQTLKDKAEIQELLLSYDQAAENLKEAHIAKRTTGSNHPEYEALVKE